MSTINANAHNEIGNILYKIQECGVEIYVQSECDHENCRYIRGDIDDLLTIDAQINIHFPVCKTRFVQECYVPLWREGSLHCEHWTEDIDGDNWCKTIPCQGKKILEIEIPTMSSKEIIEKCFSKNG